MHLHHQRGVATEEIPDFPIVLLRQPAQACSPLTVVRRSATAAANSSKRSKSPRIHSLLGQHPEFRKRVIVEELLHLRVPTHSKLFKTLLKACLRR